LLQDPASRPAQRSFLPDSGGASHGGAIAAGD